MGVAIAMGAMAAGSALFGSMQQGQQQVTQNAIQRAQFEEQEFQRKMQNQVKNRQIAKVNAAKWMANRNIAKAANKARAEEEFWIDYNFNNASGQFSREFSKAHDQIRGVFTSRNVKLNSGTTRALMRSSIESGQRGMISQRVSQGNAFLSAERKQQALLARRDFGYNDQIPFMPGQLIQQSDSSIMSTALTTGLITGAMSGASAYMGAKQSQAQTAATQASAGATQNLAWEMGGLAGPSPYQGP